jgi:hypothetical protein
MYLGKVAHSHNDEWQLGWFISNIELHTCINSSRAAVPDQDDPGGPLSSFEKRRLVSE